MDKIIIQCEDKYLSKAFQNLLFDHFGFSDMSMSDGMDLMVNIKTREYGTIDLKEEGSNPDYFLPRQWDDAIDSIEFLIKPKEKSFEEKLREVLISYDKKQDIEPDFSIITIRSLVNEYYTPKKEIEKSKPNYNNQGDWGSNYTSSEADGYLKNQI